MSYIGNIPTTVAFLVDTFSGNGSTTAFTLSQAPANTSSILVAVSGVVQDPSTYSVSGTTLTFSGAPPSGSSNISVRFLGIPASNIATTAYRTVTEFTATAGQTTFSVPSYTAGYIDVYRNGVMLGSADYTATSGTTVVLANPATAGDLVETISFYVSSVLNAIPAVANAVTDAYINTGAVTQSKLGNNVAGNGPAFSAYKNSGNQSITSATFTKITFDTELFDTNSNFASSTFTPTVAGYYQINTGLSTSTSASQSRVILLVYKNGNAIYALQDLSIAAFRYSGGTIVQMNGTTDYLEIYAYIVGTSIVAESGLNSTGYTTWFNGALIRAA
jgi:hypothetical protein